MSFDVLFGAFRAGAAVTVGADRMREVLEPWVVHRAPELSFLQVEVGDGKADVYLDDDTMMANNVSGEDPWEVLVLGARAAGWVISPVGCRTCLTDESQREHLPVELASDVVLVTSGAELLAVILSG